MDRDEAVGLFEMEICLIAVRDDDHEFYVGVMFSLIARIFAIAENSRERIFQVVFVNCGFEFINSD